MKPGHQWSWSVIFHPPLMNVEELTLPNEHATGRSFMPSLAIMTLQPDCLLALLQALTPPPPSSSLASTRCERTGFAGWNSIPGAGAASGADAGVSTGATSDSAGGGSASRPSHGSHASVQHGDSRVDTGVREGLSVGHASVRDARLAVYIILLVKYRLDGAALEAGGGCKELQKVRLPHVLFLSPCVSTGQNKQSPKNTRSIRQVALLTTRSKLDAQGSLYLSKDHATCSSLVACILFTGTMGLTANISDELRNPLFSSSVMLQAHNLKNRST